MSEEKTEKAAEKPAEPKAKGGKGKGKMVIILSVVGVLALGGGGFAYYKFLGPGAKAEGGEGKDGHAAAAKEEEAGTGVVSFEPFLANLSDPGGGRFARVSVKLIVGDEKEAKEVQEKAVVVTRLRAAILELIAAEKADVLVTPEGKAELRKKISEQAAGIVKPVKVSDVLFSDFVVQF